MSRNRLAKDWAVRGEEVDNSVREASAVVKDLVDEVVGEDGGVTGLPKGHITLKNDGSEPFQILQ